VQGKISLLAKTGRVAERRNALRAELDTLRDRQLASKSDRGATATELKTIQEQTRTMVLILPCMIALR